MLFFYSVIAGFVANKVLKLFLNKYLFFFFLQLACFEIQFTIRVVLKNKPKDFKVIYQQKRSNRSNIILIDFGKMYLNSQH